MSSSKKSTDAPIVAEGGLNQSADSPADPFQALDDLMVVVEELCPVWPARPTFADESNYLL